METWYRGSGIRLVCVHTNEGPEGPNTAESLAVYLRSIQGGYHKIVDENSFVVCAADNMAVAGAPYVNNDGLHICITGWSYQTDWNSPGEQRAIDLMSQLVAQWCMIYKLPARRLTIDQLRDGQSRGICGHVDVTNAFKYKDSRLDHTDPGPNFPWGEFIDKVNHYINPTPAPKPKPPEPPKPKWTPMLITFPAPGQPVTDATMSIWDNDVGDVRLANGATVYKLDGTQMKSVPFGKLWVFPHDQAHWPAPQWQYGGMEPVKDASGNNIGFTQVYQEVATGKPHYREWRVKHI